MVECKCVFVCVCVRASMSAVQFRSTKITTAKFPLEFQSRFWNRGWLPVGQSMPKGGKPRHGEKLIPYLFAVHGFSVQIETVSASHPCVCASILLQSQNPHKIPPRPLERYQIKTITYNHPPKNEGNTETAQNRYGIGTTLSNCTLTFCRVC